LRASQSRHYGGCIGIRGLVGAVGRAPATLSLLDCRDQLTLAHPACAGDAD